MTLAPLVALCSPAAGSGKSTTAAALEARGWLVVKFAGPLKAMLAALLREAGEDGPSIQHMLEGCLKAEPSETLAGRTPRHAMQTLGTEWGRAHIAESFWTDIAMRRAARYRLEGIPVVIDDCRFPNEAEAVRDAGGQVVEIRRDGASTGTSHVSEGGLAGFPFDLVIRNADACATEWGLRSSSIIARLAHARGAAA